MSLLQELEKQRRARLARILAAAVPDHGIDLKPAPAAAPEPPEPPREPPEPPRDWLYVGSGFEQRDRVHIIVSTVCVHFSISPNELKSACRIHPIVRARHVASFLLRELLALSLPKIGTILGGRDHTTILNGYNRIKHKLAEGDPELSALIDHVRGLVLARNPP